MTEENINNDNIQIEEEVKLPAKKPDKRSITSQRNMATARKAKLDKLYKLRQQKAQKQEENDNEDVYEISDDSSSESSESSEDEVLYIKKPKKKKSNPPSKTHPNPQPRVIHQTEHFDDRLSALTALVEKLAHKPQKKPRAKRKTVVKIVNNKPQQPQQSKAKDDLISQFLKF